MRQIAKLASKTSIVIAFAALGIQIGTAQSVADKMMAKMAVAALLGITDCHVMVENLNDAAIGGGLNERKIQSEVSAKLNEIGIRTGDANPSANPYLYVNVHVIELPGVGYFFIVRLELHEEVIPVRDKTLLLYGATTWQRVAQGASSRENLPTKVNESLSAVLNGFRKDYLLVNSQ